MKERRLGDELSPGCLNSVWYLDTGASNHMCGDESFFSELTKVEAGLVSCGDDSKMVIKGRGTIRHMQKDGRVGEIRDVYYIPEMKSNILSIGQIVEKGNSIMIKNQVLYLKDKQGRLAAWVEKEKNRMYKLELSILQKRCLKRVDSEGGMGSVRNDVVKKETGKQIKAVRSEREVTTNLAEKVEEEVVLLMMGCSSRDEHKQVEKSARRLNVINQSSSMERFSRRANSLESLAGNLGSSDSSWSVDSSDLEEDEQEVLSLQEQLRVEKDLRVVLEVQDEKWRLGMDDKFGVKKAWKFSDLLKRVRSIQRIPVNGKSATEITKNPTKGKSVKVKMKSVKEKIKSDKEKIKSVKEKSKSAMEIEDCLGREKKKI